MADHYEDSLDTGGGGTKSKPKRIYFAPPVVGFFREPNHYPQQQQQHNQHQKPRTAAAAAANDEGTKEEQRKLLTASSGKNVTFQINNDNVPSSSDEDDEELGSIASFLKARRQSSINSGSSYGSMEPGSHSRYARSGKELWAIVRKHVFKSDFHIRDTVRSPALFQSVGPRGGRGSGSGSRHEEVHFRNIDLPYDFTLWDCLLALLAYLAISIIAFSFVFEQWSMIDSMYFAVVTFTTIGTLLLACCVLLSA